LEKTSKTLVRKEDLQQLRLAIEDAKIRLTTMPDAQISLNFNDDGIGPFTYTV
jgi:molecular chaperone DnaK (HSP70)